MTDQTPLLSDERMDMFIRNHVPLDYKPKIGVYSYRETLRDALIIQRDIYEADRQALLSVVQELIEKGDAVVKRWESPLWKDLPHTANYIDDLRNAISKIKSTYNISPKQ